MSRPSKFDLMRRNRRICATFALREEARELGYDEQAELKELQAAAQREAYGAQEVCGSAGPWVDAQPARRWWHEIFQRGHAA